MKKNEQLIKFKNYYEILEVDREATYSEIREKYIDKITNYNYRFEKYPIDLISESYGVLNNTRKKAKYDDIYDKIDLFIKEESKKSNLNSVENILDEINKMYYSHYYEINKYNFIKVLVFGTIISMILGTLYGVITTYFDLVIISPPALCFLIVALCILLYEKYNTIENNGLMVFIYPLIFGVIAYISYLNASFYMLNKLLEGNLNNYILYKYNISGLTGYFKLLISSTTELTYKARSYRVSRSVVEIYRLVVVAFGPFVITCFPIIASGITPGSLGKK